MTELSLPCSYKKESLLRIESTHIEFSKDLNRCLPSNIVHPVDGLYYTKARSGLILAYSYEGRKVSRSDGRLLPPPPVGNPLPGRRSAASGPSSRHLWKAGSVTTYTLPFTPYHRAFSSVAGFGGPKLTWLRQKASSLKARLARRPSRSARSRPAALPKPIIISVPRPHCWKGSASKPYVELPPHTAPLGMELAERHTGKEFIAPLGTSHPRTGLGPCLPNNLSTYGARRFHISRSEWDRVFSRLTVVPVEASTLKGISIAKDSIQPQVPLRLPCYDFTPVEDPTVRFQLHVPELQRTIRTEAIFPDSLRLTALLPISSALAAIKLKRTLEKKGLRLRKAPATFLLTAQLRAGTQLVALARHSAPRLTSAAKTFSLGACLSNTKRGFRSL
ncbi:hypothetical protein L1887_61951 [Cichorium endivia]|nr:hypothetical protein L1887_61951 [Cichorium endivia]